MVLFYSSFHWDDDPANKNWKRLTNFQQFWRICSPIPGQQIMNSFPIQKASQTVEHLLILTSIEILRKKHVYIYIFTNIWKDSKHIWYVHHVIWFRLLFFVSFSLWHASAHDAQGHECPLDGWERIARWQAGFLNDCTGEAKLVWRFGKMSNREVLRDFCWTEKWRNTHVAKMRTPMNVMELQQDFSSFVVGQTLFPIKQGVR